MSRLLLSLFVHDSRYASIQAIPYLECGFHCHSRQCITGYRFLKRSDSDKKNWIHWFIYDSRLTSNTMLPYFCVFFACSLQRMKKIKAPYKATATLAHNQL